MHVLPSRLITTVCVFPADEDEFLISKIPPPEMWMKGGLIEKRIVSTDIWQVITENSSNLEWSGQQILKLPRDGEAPDLALRVPSLTPPSFASRAFSASHTPLPRRRAAAAVQTPPRARSVTHLAARCARQSSPPGSSALPSPTRISSSTRRGS